ncbi:MAG TPA: alpha/beta hydrolase [Candidatus Lustribacter sp.]
MTASTQRTIDLGDGDVTTLEQWGASGPALLCVHGIASSRKSWARTAEAFAGSYRVFAYDQRGHGDSAAIAGPMTHEQSVRDLQAVARAIDGDVFALIGHSWGGAIVLKSGRDVACERVIAIDPMIHQAAGRWTSDFIEDLEPVFADPANARDGVIRALFAGLPPVEVEAKLHALRHMSIEPIVALGADNGADAGRWDLREDVRGYPHPLLLLLADPADSVVFPEDVEFVRRHGGSNVTIEVFEGAGHTLHRTAFERFAASVSAFLGARGRR